MSVTTLYDGAVATLFGGNFLWYLAGFGKNAAWKSRWRLRFRANCQIQTIGIGVWRGKDATWKGRMLLVS